MYTTEGALYRRLRLKKPDLTQVRLAERTGLRQPGIAAIEAGKRNLTEALRDKIDPVIALGKRSRGERRPVYLLVEILEGGAARIVADDEGRPAAFIERAIAADTAGWLRRIGIPGIYPAPAWASFLDELALRPDVTIDPNQPCLDWTDDAQEIAGRVVKLIEVFAQARTERPAFDLIGAAA